VSGPSGTRVTPAGWTVAARPGPVVCVATSTRSVSQESTFILAHMARLPTTVTVLSGLEHPPLDDDGRPVAPSPSARLWRAAARRSWRFALATAQDAAIARHLRRQRVRLVLAEFGPTAHRLAPACRLAGVPLVAHFHGYDASVEELIRHHGGYARVFERAAAVVAVSRDMVTALRGLGAPASRLVYNPYGVDTEHFSGGAPGRQGPTFVAVGRFVEKKAPELTLLAFQRVVAQHPAARLVMVGDGPLLGPCQRAARALGLSSCVELAGREPPHKVIERLRTARAFVQHSVRARDGDSEGTPLAVLEAAATGLPVVATRHGGIKDVVLEGETGLLVEEEDVAGMAEHMAGLAADPDLAARLGEAGRRRTAALFTIERSMAGLWAIVSPLLEARADPV
jgi:colanic acid/amylovoran biosynthesis glycosyltransferase